MSSSRSVKGSRRATSMLSPPRQIHVSLGIEPFDRMTLIIYSSYSVHQCCRSAITTALPRPDRWREQHTCSSLAITAHPFQNRVRKAIHTAQCVNPIRSTTIKHTSHDNHSRTEASPPDNGREGEEGQGEGREEKRARGEAATESGRESQK